MTENNDFAQGIYFKRPAPTSPGFVKGKISIKVEDFVPFLEETKNSAGYVNLDLLLAKDGEKLYLKVDRWEPAPKEGGDDSI